MKKKIEFIIEDFNNGLSKEEILKKYNIKNSTLQVYLSRARKRGIEVKTRKKAKPKYMQVAEDWNNGLPEEEILAKYNIKSSTLKNYLSEAKKTREKAKPKYILVAEDWNNGLPEEEILEKYNIVKKILQAYLSQARKRGIEVKTREKAKPKYMQVAEDWNNGLSEEEILKKYNIIKSTLQNYLSRARKRGIEVKSREKAKLKYVQIVEDWNNGLSKEEILKKYNIKKSTLQSYLSQARKRGIEVKAKEKAKPKYMEVTEDRNNGLSEEEIIFQKDQKRSREKIKESLKLYLPRQVAKRLKISTKTVFDVMDSLNSEEEKEVNRAFIRNRPYVFSRVKKLKKDGKSVLEALKSIESNIPLHFLSQLQEVYYNLRLYSYIEKSINNRLYLDETISGKEKEYLKGLKDNMRLEVISVQIRKNQKEALESEKTISYDRLCKEFNVRTSFLVDLLGREEKDY